MITFNQMEKDIAYRVIKGNTDGSIEKGDLIYIDSRDGSIVCKQACGWFDKEELDNTITDFKCEKDKDLVILSLNRSKSFVMRKTLEKALAFCME